MAFDKLKNYFNVDIKDGLPGKAVVQSASAPNRGSTHYNVEMWLDVYLEGREPYRVKHHCQVRATKHPFPGTTLPVVVARDNRERIDIQWDQVKTVDEIMAEGKPGQVDVSGSLDLGGLVQGGVTIQQEESHVVDVSGSEAAEKIRQLLAQQGVDPGESGTVQLTGEAAAAMSRQIQEILAGEGRAEAGAGDDPVTQIERLAKLRDQGVLSPSEFETAKRKLLEDL